MSGGARIIRSSDAEQWESVGLMELKGGDVRDPQLSMTGAGQLMLTACVWCGDGRIVALIRDDRRRHGHPLLQVTSRDNGATWQPPARTNIPPGGHGAGAFGRNASLAETSANRRTMGGKRRLAEIFFRGASLYVTATYAITHALDPRHRPCAFDQAHLFLLD